MTWFLRSLSARWLNLDLNEGVKFVAEPGRPLAKPDFWRLMRCLFRQALGDGASAIRLCHEEQADVYRMWYCLAGVWYEMTPPPPEDGRQALSRLRSKCRLGGSRREGQLLYIREQRVRLAHCVSPDPDDLCVFFTEQRPIPVQEEVDTSPNVSVAGSTGRRVISACTRTRSGTSFTLTTVFRPAIVPTSSR